MTEWNDPSGSTFTGVNIRLFLIRQARSAPVAAARLHSSRRLVAQDQDPGGLSYLLTPGQPQLRG
jgi:hypothetical protein